jgi:CO/xanthine dehydrogenase FAD-binding subunit
MLPFDFEYYLPDNTSDAFSIFERLQKENKNPVYFGGGTELISRGRVGNITFGAVIDIKGISELRQIKDSGKEIVIGGAVTLREITDSKMFPFLGATVKRIADHTIQNKITLAGNLLGGIIYKAAILPLLLLDAKVITYRKNGINVANLIDIYQQKIALKKGELLMEIRVDKSLVNLPWYHNKFVKGEKIDYPLITLGAVRKNTETKYAVTGFYNYPSIIEKNTYFEKDIDIILDDHIGSASYRIDVLKRLLVQADKELNL